MYPSKEKTILNNKCGGCTRRCIYNAKPIKIHNTDLYIPTINDTATIFFKQPFQQTQACFCTIERCIEYAREISEKRPRHYHNKIR